MEIGTGKLYQVIYADPPWRYEFPISLSRKIENQYPTMSLEEIGSMKIPSEKDSVLFMWSTAPKLEESLQIMKLWGFVYRSHAIWDKDKLGMGYWFRISHEILLVGLKGKFKCPEPSMRIKSIFKQKIRRHSSKPYLVKELIEKWYPEASKIELFSRHKSIGWDVFGNDENKDLVLLLP